MNKVANRQRAGLVLHHTDTLETETVAGITAMHRKKRFETVGYHYLIKRDFSNNSASIKHGRGLDYQGGHTYIDSKEQAKKDPEAKGDQQYYNKRWLGVAMIGDYHKNTMNAEYYKSVIQSVAHIMKVNNLKRLRGHRECDATACPGQYINMDKVRADISKILGFTITK